MQTMEDSVNDLLAAGEITAQTARTALKESTDDDDGGLDDTAAPAPEQHLSAKEKNQGPARVSPPVVGGSDGGGYSF
jgi:hypothetical protein